MAIGEAHFVKFCGLENTQEIIDTVKDLFPYWPCFIDLDERELKLSG